MSTTANQPSPTPSSSERVLSPLLKPAKRMWRLYTQEQRLTDDRRFTDTRKDEQERGITIKSTAISLYAHMPDPEDIKDIPQVCATQQLPNRC